MKAIQTLSDRHDARSTSTFTSPSETIDRALALLAEGGFGFEPVDRCPAPCRSCDNTLNRAA